MTEPAYRFLAERLEAVIRASATAFTEDDLEDTWEGIVEDGCEEVFVFSSQQLPAAAAALADVGAGPDPRTISGHPEALDRLDRHEGCAELLQGLTAQRDDALSALLRARTYCRNETYEGKYGDRNLAIDGVLDALRPTVPGQCTYATLNYPGYCDACQTMDGHEDDCWVEAQRVRLETRRQHAIASHLHCPGMGQSLTEQVLRCLTRIEAIAQRVRTSETYAEDDGMVVRPGDLIPAFRLAELNVTFDQRRPATIAAARHQDVE